MKIGLAKFALFSALMTVHILALVGWQDDQPRGGQIISQQISIAMTSLPQMQEVSAVVSPPSPEEVIEEETQEEPEKDIVEDAVFEKPVVEVEPVITKEVVTKEVGKSAPTPKRRPKQMEASKKPEVKKAKPRKERQKPNTGPKPVIKETVAVPKSAGQSAQKNTRSMGSKADFQTVIASYFGELQAHIAAKKLPGAGRQGVVSVRFEMDVKGQLLNFAIAKSSGIKALDRIALKSVKNAAPFPIPPVPMHGQKLVFTIPYLFK